MLTRYAVKRTKVKVTKSYITVDVLLILYKLQMCCISVQCHKQFALLFYFKVKRQDDELTN